MDQTTDAGTTVGSQQQPVTQITVEGEGKLSVTEAARALATARHQKPKDQQEGEQRTEGAAAPDPAQESTAEAGDAASPDTETRGETEGVDREAELPPIEPPRSWTKDDKELFTSLPRETQERLAERERSRESDFLRRQNEAAEKLKGLTTKEQAVEQARQQYDAALPILLQNLQGAMAGEFADIKTWPDVQKMAAEDWPRYVRWDAQQKQIATAQQDMHAAAARQQQERAHKFAEFAGREDDLFKQKAPDMADADKADKLQKSAMTVLKDLGFAEAELAQSWNGQKDLSLRDHRVQLLIRDATLWREAQAKAKAATAKHVPPVQRPGVSHGKGAAQEAQVQTLTKRLETASGVNALRTAAQLVRAKRAAR